MKNQYVGDIGDYGKIGLISTLKNLEPNLKLGVNWYHFDGTHHSENKNDGKHYTYLIGKRKDYQRLSNLFPEIYEEFKEKFTHIVNGEINIYKENRLISNLEKVSCLKNVVFYSDIICARHRDVWFNKSLEILSETEIIFLDPDNGLEYIEGSGGEKHVLIHELEKYLKLRKSIILYNHRDRKPNNIYFSKFMNVANKNGVCVDCLRIIRANKGTARDYVFFTQKRHKKIINDLIHSLTVAKKYMFQEIDLNHYSSIQ